MYIINYLFNKPVATKSLRDKYIDDYKAIIEKIEALDDDGEAEANGGNIHVEESYMPNAEFFRYKGIVTHLYADGKGRIDDKYMFNSGAVGHRKLKKGDRVLCMARKISDDQPIAIYKIESVIEDSWAPNGEDDFDIANASDPVPLNTYIRVLRGEIKGKLNGEIAIDTCPATPKPIKLVISEIGCRFNPMIGDQVEIETQFGINHNDPTDFAVIGYYGMKPTEQKFITGEITDFRKVLQYGLIDNKYLFYMDVLQHSNNQNVMPNKGDTVSSNVISSHQKIDDREFFYRCTDLVKIRSDKKRDDQTANNANQAHEESDDEHGDDGCGMIFTKNNALIISLDGKQKQKTIEFVVQNNSDRSHRISAVSFKNQILASIVKCNDLYRYHNVQPGGRFVYKIDVLAVISGKFKIKMDFKIDNKIPMRRTITVNVQNADEISGPRVTHTKAYTKKVYSEQRETIKGQAPVVAPHFIDQRLDRFEVPRKLFENMMQTNSHNEMNDLLEIEFGELFSTLSRENYGRFFHALLHLEEIFMCHEFRMYDQDRGHFIRDGEYLAYEMQKNVFECRPSIVIGDMIYAESLLKTSESEATTYQGFIHKMSRNRLLLKFNEEFHNRYLGEDYRLIFKFSRSKWIKQHNAIERISKKLLEKNSQFLFPNTIRPEKRLQMPVVLIDGNITLEYGNSLKRQTIPWYNSRLNDIQKEAVVNVLRGEVKMCPYLVFGPPGTGKTSTLIEIILQLYKKGNTWLIVAAPSNSAANLITKLLGECGAMKAGEFARIVSQNAIERDQIPIEIRQHCVTADIAAPRSTIVPENPFENGIQQCTSDILGMYRILIATCSTFGSLLHMKFKGRHFTHVIVDEAGQCTETEIAIPISLIDRDDGQIILAGDPHQLGPIVLSPYSKQRGLGKSLLQRLLDRLPYHKDVGRNGGFDERMVTQLLHNYRSLPSILNTYSYLSYESKLIANVSQTDSAEQKILANVQANMNPACRLNHVPNCGIYFVGVVGTDERPFDSTSWRNLTEALEVVTIVNQLFVCGLTEDDIGIITPYTCQVKEIRSMGDTFFNGKQPKIGSVEEFQGQERNVIIISTVRSKERNISHDTDYGLGFINNKNRVNVAISRARAILIIIGNPNLLARDDNWRYIIKECKFNGSYSGCEISNDILQMDDDILKKAINSS